MSPRATSTYGRALKRETKFHTKYETTDKIKVLSVLHIFMFVDKKQLDKCVRTLTLKRTTTVLSFLC
jgi:hypothetical protein